MMWAPPGHVFRRVMQDGLAFDGVDDYLKLEPAFDLSADVSANTMWRNSLFWIRDVFWPQHPRCWDQNTSQIQILRHFRKKRGAMLSFKIDWPWHLYYFCVQVQRVQVQCVQVQVQCKCSACKCKCVHVQCVQVQCVGASAWVVAFSPVQSIRFAPVPCVGGRAAVIRVLPFRCSHRWMRFARRCTRIHPTHTHSTPSHFGSNTSPWIATTSACLIFRATVAAKTTILSMPTTQAG